MDNAPLWVFGYGSLMWNPGFEFEQRMVARLSGFARSFCMRSIHHRGTVENPGLVLALDKSRNATCNGLALCVSAGHEGATLDYLRERELISSAYLEATLPITLSNGQNVQAVTFIMDTTHDQYCGDLPLSEQATIIASAVGGRGDNAEYLHNTAIHLAELGINDPELEWLSEAVQKMAQNNS